MDNVVNLLKRLRIKEFSLKTSSFMEMIKFKIGQLIKIKVYHYLDDDTYVLRVIYDDLVLNTERFTCFEDLEDYIIREFNICKKH